MPRSLVHVLTSALATALLITATSFTGLLSPVLLLAVPLPVAYAGLIGGVWAGLGGVVLAAVLLAYDNWAGAVQYLLVFGPGSLLVPQLLKRRVRWDRSAAAGTLASLAVMMPTGAAVAAGMGESLTGLVRELITGEVAALEQLYSGMNIPTDQLAELHSYGEVLIEWVPRLYPAFVTVALGGVMLVMVLALRRLIQGRLEVHGPPFRNWTLPEPLVWGVIASGFALVVPSEPLRIAALNVLIVLLPLYFLQGMAIVATFLVRRNMPPFVRGMVYLLIVILNPLPLLVTVVGVFDLWVDFRKPRIKKS